jgi:hypothetical protein
MEIAQALVTLLLMILGCYATLAIFKKLPEKFPLWLMGGLLFTSLGVVVGTAVELPLWLEPKFNNSIRSMHILTFFCIGIGMLFFLLRLSRRVRVFRKSSATLTPSKT